MYIVDQNIEFMFTTDIILNIFIIFSIYFHTEKNHY